MQRKKTDRPAKTNTQPINPVRKFTINKSELWGLVFELQAMTQGLETGISMRINEKIAEIVNSVGLFGAGEPV